MNFKSNETIWSQIIEYVKKKIFSGAFAIRDFAGTCRVNPNTVVRVYAQLEEEGLIYTDGTNGKFVTADAAFIARRREEYLRAKAGAFAEEMRGALVPSSVCRMRMPWKLPSDISIKSSAVTLPSFSPA